MACPLSNSSFINSFAFSPPFSMLDPVKKNVAFTLFSSNILKISGVLVFDVPSSKVKNTTFLPSFE